MSNPFYVYDSAFIPGILARAEALSAEFTAVQQGFNLLAVQGTDSGSANAYAVATKGGQNGVYTDGLIVEFKAANANTGGSTIAVDSGSTVGLTDFQGQTLASGAIKKNSWIRCLYNSTYSAWTLIAPTSQVITSNTISAAAPTHLVGLTAAGGVSTACAPIDVTFAIDQSIVPTWTGAHTFGSTVTFSSTVTFTGGLSLTGNSGQYAATLTGSSSTGNSLGLRVNAGTNASDFALRVSNQSGGTDYFRVLGEGSALLGNPTGGGQGAGTLNATGLYVNGVAVSTVMGANPSASVGLSAVNGSATTYLRSDGAPALAQSIAPTWTGAHTFSYTGGVPVTVNAAANKTGLVINGGTNTSNTFLAEILTGSGSGFSSGLLIQGGTSSADSALTVSTAAAAAIINVRGDGVTIWTGAASQDTITLTPGTSGQGINLKTNHTVGIPSLRFTDTNASPATFDVGLGVGDTTASLVIYDRTNTVGKLKISGGTSGTVLSGYGPTVGALVDMTPDTGTFTVTYTGFTTSPTGTARWARIGNVVLLTLPTFTATSNSTSFTATGLPAAIQPAHTQDVVQPSSFEDNTAITSGCTGATFTASSGTITFFRNQSATGWNGGAVTKGLVGSSGGNVVFQYLLN